MPRGVDLETAEGRVRDGVLAIKSRPLEASVAARGEGDCRKGVQTVVGWITIRRAYSGCPSCGHGHCPLDAHLGLARDSLSPGVRRLTGQLGAVLPFAEAARTLADTARIHVSASSVRTVTEAVGARREAEVAAAIAAAWRAGLPPALGPAPERLYVAMDGVRMRGIDGDGRGVKVGVVAPVPGRGATARRAAASYAAGLESAACFGQRLALEAHCRGLETAGMIAVLSDGAAWIWALAAEHFPTALQIVDWFHASEREWARGRALSAAETPETTTWVEQQLGRLAQGRATTLAREWQTLPCRGEVAAVRVLLLNQEWHSYALAA